MICIRPSFCVKAMIELLGQRFSSGASVRNEDGMLPLHLVLIACASPVATSVVSDVDVFDIVQTVVKLFPGAIGVPDNEGNLPIHTAASVLHGPRGAGKANSVVIAGSHGRISFLPVLFQKL